MLLDFLRDNWRLLLEIAFAIVIVVTAIVRKKPINDIIGTIYKFSVLAINSVEKEGITGSKEKLEAAVSYVNSLLINEYPDLKIGTYNSWIIKTIEFILSTPQKKED